MKCDACKGEELVVIKVPRYSKPVIITGYVLALLALVVMLGSGYSIWRSTVPAAGDDPAERAKQAVVTKLQQINAVTPEMIKDFQDDGQISETNLSKLGPDDRVEVDAILTDYKNGAFAPAAAAGPDWFFWGLILGASAVVLIVGLAMIWRKEMLKCAKCGAMVELI